MVGRVAVLADPVLCGPEARQRGRKVQVRRTHLALRADGTGYYGKVNRVEESYVEIRNGDFLQNLYFAQPLLFTEIEVPVFPSFKLGQPQLKL